MNVGRYFETDDGEVVPAFGFAGHGAMCRVCYSLVPRIWVKRHAAWHEELDRLIHEARRA